MLSTVWLEGYRREELLLESVGQPPLPLYLLVPGAAKQGRRLACAWDQILDLDDPSMNLDLSDPFVEEEAWTRHDVDSGDTAEGGLWARLARFRISGGDRRDSPGAVALPERSRRRT